LQHGSAMIHPAQDPHSLLVLHLKLGLVCRNLVEKLIDIEGEFGKLERKRKHTPKEILAYADTSLCVVSEALRGCLRLMADDPTMAAAHDRIESLLRHSNMPTPLYLLAMEMREIHHGRKSPLFSKGGVPSQNFLRRQIEAFAAACVQVLKQYGISHSPAAKLIAEKLNKHAFPNPNKDPYSPGAVLEWLKRRRTRQRAGGKNDIGDFEANFRRYRVYLRGIAGPIASRGDKKGAIEAVLERFGSFLDHSIICPDQK
jgi:hypothetical protein